MKTIWKVIDHKGKSLEVELSGELYGGEFRVKNVNVINLDYWDSSDPVDEEDFDWVIEQLIDKDSVVFEIFNEVVVNEGNGDVLDVSLL